MPEYPLLPLPIPDQVNRPKGGSARNNLKSLTPTRQTERIGPIFQRLRGILERPNAELDLRSDPSSIAPERAIVFEVAGSIQDFYTAARRIPGLEFVGDEETEFEPDEDFALPDSRKGKVGQVRSDKKVGGRLYLAMSDIAALRQLLSLWDRWQKGEKLARGFASWQQLFSYLLVLRTWGPADRISEETMSYWRESLRAGGDTQVRTEVELWYHERQERRHHAWNRFEQVVLESNGTIVDHAVVEGIAYEGALVDIPSDEVRVLLERRELRLAICDEIAFLRPQSVVELPKNVEESEPGEMPEAPSPQPNPPIAAVLDAVPVQRHRLLEGRLIYDDPDDLQSMSTIGERYHGTEMASIVLYGDRNLNEIPLPRAIYFRPILFAPGNNHPEQCPMNRLLVDVIYRAIKRMKEGDQEGPPTARDVFLINLSLGDKHRPFSGPMTPLGKLLDYLANRYNVLFMVSAGNSPDPLPIPAFDNWSAFESADAQIRERAVLSALSEQKSQRTLLSPGEAINVLTIGAWHDDAVTDAQQSPMSLDPFEGNDLPNVSSALGLGYGKIIKPDMHLPGGKEPVTVHSTGDSLRIMTRRFGRFGIKAAMPDSKGDLGKEGLASGTSVATALATRAAHRLFDMLMDQAGGSFHSEMDQAHLPVVIKALLVHRAKWGEKGPVLQQLYGPRGQGQDVARRDNISRLLGYGSSAVDEAMECSSNRATLVGFGEISNPSLANKYSVPLPSSLERVTEPRTLIVTVAWMAPINPRSRSYRTVKLNAGPVSPLESSFGVERATHQPAYPSTGRGTLFHVRYEGSRAVPFIDDGHISFQVWCTAPHLDQPVRYGFAITIEAGEAIPVYEQIRERLQIRPRAAT